MHIDFVSIKGFRNYDDAQIRLSKQTLIIGSNDIGKTNLIHALRILLDKNLSDMDIEPSELDFHIKSNGNQAEVFEILIKFSSVEQDAVISILKGHVSDDKDVYLKYVACKKDLSYKLYIGNSQGKLEEIDGRFYLKYVNLKYIRSQRDLQKYIQTEKKHLLKLAQESRTSVELDQDNVQLQKISRALDVINMRVSRLHYVSSATNNVNEELKSISSHHQNYTVHLDSGAIQVNQFIDRLELGGNSNGAQVMLGGDGRNNQILMALWKAKSIREHDLNSEVVFYCIEEPEAHLHPHQQRKLADYLVKELPGQSIITSHSPQIVSQYSPDSIVRLLAGNSGTRAASGGCSNCISSAWSNMGYRMSILPAEAFFASAVLLVEGPSESVFYTALAKAIGVDLDFHNISILSVDGVQFEVYCQILKAMEIPWSARTDNDVSDVNFTKPQKRTLKNLAGINRCYSLIGMEKLAHREPPLCSTDLVNDGTWGEVSKYINPHGIFLSKIDLENDLAIELPNQVASLANPQDVSAGISYLQDKKAIRMRDFVLSNSAFLTGLRDGELAKPILFCLETVSGG